MGSVPTQRGTRLVALCVVGLLLALAGCADDTDGEAADPRLPTLVLEQIGGGELDLAAPAATPRVFNLWGTWCPPCRAELPAFEEVAGRTDDDLEIIGINVGDRRESAVTFVDELGLSFPQLLDPDAQFNELLEVTNMPTTVFTRADGTIAFTHIGAIDIDGLEELIEEHLGVDLAAPSVAS